MIEPHSGTRGFPDGERASSYVRLLHEGGARRLAHAEAYGLDVPSLAQQGYLRVLHGPLGPVVVPGRLGYLLLGLSARPMTASAASHEVALRAAVSLALERGYTPAQVTSKYVRLQDERGHDHYLYVRINTAPRAERVARMIRVHRQSFRRGRGTLILCVLDASPYAHQVARQPRLQVWEVQ